VEAFSAGSEGTVHPYRHTRRELTKAKGIVRCLPRKVRSCLLLLLLQPAGRIGTLSLWIELERYKEQVVWSGLFEVG